VRRSRSDFPGTQQCAQARRLRAAVIEPVSAMRLTTIRPTGTLARFGFIPSSRGHGGHAFLIKSILGVAGTTTVFAMSRAETHAVLITERRYCQQAKTR